MESVQDIKAAWHSFPPVLSRPNLVASFCRDSSYTSDELSGISIITSITAGTGISSSEIGIQVPQGPKSVRRESGPDANAKDIENFEPSYDSDDSKSEFAEQLEFSISADPESDTDVGFDEIFECELSSEAPLDAEDPKPSHQHESYTDVDDDDGDDYDGDDDYDVDFDDSHIKFENSVRFDTDVAYIDAPDLDDDQYDNLEMTWHEIMEMSLSRGQLQTVDGDGNSDCSSTGDESVSTLDSFTEDDSEGKSIPNGPEEHPRELIELDKQLFIAYMNGIRGVPDNQYQPRLHSRAQEIREGRIHCPFFESETLRGVYLDEVLNHVIGIFRNVVERDEFDELVRLCEAKVTLEQSDTPAQDLERHMADFLGKIEHLLSERLTDGSVTIGKDELGFFAGGVAYALENWSVYTYGETPTSDNEKEVLNDETKI
jgi:hypothetical protein